MAPKYPKNRIVAKLVTENRQPCVFCQQDVDDEVIYGKLYSLGDIQCHYFCVLLSCCLVQKGKDSEGLFGFLYKDIVHEVERSRKHKCSYCGRGGASLGCAVTSCRKQFHLPCGRQKNAVSLYYGNYKSFCEVHAPKQKISDSVMVHAKARIKRDKLIKAGKIPVPMSEEDKQTEEDSAMVCVICYEEVQGYPTTQTFWPPCCGRDAWLHRSCLQRMALSAGMHYLKCPLCNDKDNFYEAVCDQGYYLPDRDAAWELEQNAFAEMYSRDTACAAADCKCPFGRTHDELGIWDIKLCLLCGSWGMHAHCLGGERPVCACCRPAAEDIEQLETRLTAVILAEQEREQRNARSGPVMPSRMSLRRTKGRAQPHSSTSSSLNLPALDSTQTKMEPRTPTKEREDAKPRKPLSLKDLESRFLSPVKMLEQCMEKGDVVVSDDVIQKIRLRFNKPRPLSAKKKIVNEILDDMFKNAFKDALKSKEPVREWNSPKKSLEVSSEFCIPKRIPELMLNTDEIQTGFSMKVDRAETIVENVAAEPRDNEESNKDEDNTNCSSHEENHVDETYKENDPNGSNDNNIIANDTPINNDTALEDNIDIPNDESTTSTFQLSTEFIAENDDSLPILETPKKMEITQDTVIEISERDITNIDVAEIGSDNDDEVKTPQKMEITQDTVIEISERDITNIDVAEIGSDNDDEVKTPQKMEITQDTIIEISERDITNIDVAEIESDNDDEVKTPQKMEITQDTIIEISERDISNINVEETGSDKENEVINSNHSDDKLLILKFAPNKDNDFGSDVNNSLEDKSLQDTSKCNERKKAIRKRKLEMKDEVSKKRRKTKLKIKIKTSAEKTRDRHRGRKFEKIKEIKKKLVGDKRVMVKIKLKDKSKVKKTKKTQKVKSFKQYVLKYSPVRTDKVIAKPDVDVSPIKRKYTKTEKPVDKLVQTSIQSFFKAI